MARIYLAGPLFTLAERDFNSWLAEELRGRGHEVWLPQDQEPRDRTAEAIFANDVKGLDWSNVVVANMDGPDPDSGTCWECGYAFHAKKPIILFRTDMRGIDDGNLAPFNIMLAESANYLVSGCNLFGELIEHICGALAAVERDAA